MNRVLYILNSWSRRFLFDYIVELSIHPCGLSFMEQKNMKFIGQINKATVQYLKGLTITLQGINYV